jgi:hypothetical protein
MGEGEKGNHLTTSATLRAAIAACRAIFFAAGQSARLLDPAFARDAALVGQIALDPGDVLASPGCDLVEVVDAERVERALHARIDAVDEAQVVARAIARRRHAGGANFGAGGRKRRKGVLSRRGRGRAFT